MRQTLAGLFDVPQAKAWLSAYVVHRYCSLFAFVGVWRRMRLSGLPRRPGGSEVWAVGVVRDEVDIIESSIRHLLDQGVDGIIVCDHLSTDGTLEVLRALAAQDARVHVTSDSHPGHLQAERITRLAQRAWWAGAGWVVPFDADEFWFAPGLRLKDSLLKQSSRTVRARVYNLVPVGAASAPIRQRLYRRDGGNAVPKVAFRAHPLAVVGPGNHGVNLAGPVGIDAVVAHVPYRSPEQMRQKFRTGSVALDAAGDDASVGWHWRAGARMATAELARVWSALVGGESIPSLGWEPGDLGAPTEWLAYGCWPRDERGR